MPSSTPPPPPAGPPVIPFTPAWYGEAIDDISIAEAYKDLVEYVEERAARAAAAPAPEGPLLSTREVAWRFRSSVRQVQRWARSGYRVLDRVRDSASGELIERPRTELLRPTSRGRYNRLEVERFEQAMVPRGVTAISPEPQAERWVREIRARLASAPRRPQARRSSEPSAEAPRLNRRRGS